MSEEFSFDPSASANPATQPAPEPEAAKDASVDTPEPAPELSAEEIAAQQREAEYAALDAVFHDIRKQSADSELVLPERWTIEEMIPEHLTSQEFVDLVFGTLMRAREDAKRAEEAAQAAATAEAEAAETAAQSTETESEPAESPAASVAAAPLAADSQSPESLSDADPDYPPCTDIEWMEGKETMYLYSRDFMTDPFAKWTYLALEDDKITTFVYVVREDSRVYPRPMIYTSLMNPPFNMTEDEVLDCWKAVQESELYPDIQTCEASNGDVYFFSTDYMTPFYAKSLAEFHSVEQPYSR